LPIICIGIVFEQFIEVFHKDQPPETKIRTKHSPDVVIELVALLLLIRRVSDLSID
jgi:hypothetical protein